MIAATQIFLGARAKSGPSMRSFSSEGGKGFFYAPISGSLPFGRTFTMWVKKEFADAEALGGDSLLFAAAGVGTGGGIGFRGRISQNLDPYLTCLHEGVSWNPTYYRWGKTDTGWHHLAWTVKASYNPNVVYVDGVKQSNQSSTSAFAAATNYLGLFCRTANGNPYTDFGDKIWKGKICRLVVWNSVLTDAQVADDYAQGSNVSNIDSTTAAHFYDGSMENGKVKDLISDWDAVLWGGAAVVDETPWNTTITANSNGGA